MIGRLSFNLHVAITVEFSEKANHDFEMLIYILITIINCKYTFRQQYIVIQMELRHSEDRFGKLT